MVRVRSVDASLDFYCGQLGMREVRRVENEKGRFTLAFEVSDIYETCSRLQSGGVTINRPPRDGRMAFVRSPDGISIELLQSGEALAPGEPWLSMPNTGSW